jgi:hypothetical protein
VAPLAVLSVLLSSSGCTQLSPGTVDDFGAEKRVKVTLRDGETIKGHIDDGSSVTFTTFGRVYRATVTKVSDNGDITLGNVYVQEEYERYQLQRERMETARLRVQDDTDQIYIPAYKIAEVQEISVDRMKTARVAVFWTYTVLVGAFILSARL